MPRASGRSTVAAPWRPPSAVLLLLPMGFYIYWGWSPILAAFGGDNAIYWLTANHLSPWGEALPAAAHFAAISVYPPLYPLVLALFGGGESLLCAHVVTAVLSAAGFVAIYRLAIGAGLGAWLALAVVALFAAARIALLEGLQLHSEHLYLLLSCATLALAARQPAHRRTLYLAAACVVGACLTRTFGLSLAASFVLWLGLGYRRRGLPLVATVILPLLLWQVLDDGGSRYLAQLQAAYARSGVLAQLTLNAGSLWSSWLACFGEAGQAGFLPALPAAIAAICLAGSLMRARARALDGLYALAHLGLVVLWPFPAEYERLLHPVLPVLLIHGFVAMAKLAGADPRHRAQLAALLIAIVMAAELPFAALAAARLAAAPADPALRPYRHSVAWYYADPYTAFASIGYQHAITAALRDIRSARRIPPGDCMLATKAPVAALYTGQVVHGPPPFSTPPAALEAAIRHGPCSFLFMTMSASPAFPEAYFPYQRLAPRIEIVAVYSNPVTARPAALLGTLPALPSE